MVNFVFEKIATIKKLWPFSTFLLRWKNYTEFVWDKRKLKKSFGQEIIIAGKKGRENFVTLRQSARKIIQSLLQFKLDLALLFTISLALDRLYNNKQTRVLFLVKLFELCFAKDWSIHLNGVTDTDLVEFVTDNVDHQIRTFDRYGTFYQMGMLGAATPGNEHWSREVLLTGIWTSLPRT